MFQPRDTHELTRLLSQRTPDQVFVYGTEKSETSIDLTGVPDLRVIRQNCCSLASLTIGSAAEPAQVAAHPLIRHYYPAMGHACAQLLERQPSITAVGASVFDRQPDLWPVLLALDSKTLIMDDHRNIRSIPTAQLFDGAGILQIAANEVVTGFNLPRPRFTHCACGHEEDLYLAVFLHLEDEGIAIARIALAQPGKAPVRCPQTEALLLGCEPDEFPVEKLTESLASELCSWTDRDPAALLHEVWTSLDCV